MRLRWKDWGAPAASEPRNHPVSVHQFAATAAKKGWNALVEGRLPASPASWMRDLRLHFAELARSARPPRRDPPSAEESLQLKATLAHLYNVILHQFLISGARLRWPIQETPRVTVLLVLFNRAELTLRCLRSLLGNSEVPIEVVIVDNASSDRTPELLDRLDGVTIVRNSENVGFLLAINQALRIARGDLVLLLNNDAELVPGSLEAAIGTLSSADDIGAVCGKLILPDGRLQEAGSIIWQDGSCLGYGREDQPLAPMYNFRRDVDYGSGAFLLTPRDLFVSLGGFAEEFQPAYYEDADYCVRVWKRGLRVVYDPHAVAIHFEFASSRSKSAAIKMQTERRELFRRKHADWLAGQATPKTAHVLAARSRPAAGLRILMLDDRLPQAQFGSGHPRAREILSALVDRGDFVTFYPTSFPDGEVSSDDALLQSVEAMVGYGAERLPQFLKERRAYYDRILVSRPHNMTRLKRSWPGVWPPSAMVLYDAEAIFAVRETQRRLLSDATVSPEASQRQIAAECTLAQDADGVLAVSDLDRAQFSAASNARVHTLGHALVPVPTPRPFFQRSGLLFVGTFHHDDTPNSESLFWFVENVWPRIRSELDPSIKLTVIGSSPTAKILALASREIEVLGLVNDLTDHYDRARVFIAPTRFAAGIPYKVHHAAAHGVPVVCTTLLAHQLGWQDERELSVAAVDDPAGFARACVALYRDAGRWQRQREQALIRVASDCSPERFRATIDEVLMLKRSRG